MAPEPPGWTVTSQREDFRPGPNGQLTNGVTVTFTTRGGHVGSVFIPDADYVPAKVAGLVTAKAAIMEAVGALTG
jgi:hypothetical protein